MTLQLVDRAIQSTEGGMIFTKGFDLGAGWWMIAPTEATDWPHRWTLWCDDGNRIRMALDDPNLAATLVQIMGDFADDTAVERAN